MRPLDRAAEAVTRAFIDSGWVPGSHDDYRGYAHLAVEAAVPYLANMRRPAFRTWQMEKQRAERAEAEVERLRQLTEANIAFYEAEVEQLKEAGNIERYFAEADLADELGEALQKHAHDGTDCGTCDAALARWEEARRES